MSALSVVAPLMSRPWVLGHEFRRGIESFAHHACKALGLDPVRVEWSDIRTAAISSTGTMMLADCRDDERIGRERVARLAAFVVHELLHRRYTDFGASDSRPYVRALHNALEDAWIERRGTREALLGNIGPLLQALVRDMVAESMAEVADWADPRQYPFSLAILARGYGVTVPVPGALLPVFREAARRVDACQSSHDTLALAQWVYDQLQKQGDEQDGEQGQDEGQDGAEGQGDEQEVQPGEQGGQPGADGEQDGGQQDGQSGEPGQDGEQGEGQSGAGGDEPADAGEARPVRANRQTREVEPKPGTDTGCGGSFTREARAASRAPQHGTIEWPVNAPVPGRLRYEVRRLFENTAHEWREGGFKSGSLNRSALHRVALNQPEVFSRRFSAEGVDSAVVVVLDISGSMMDGYDRENPASARLGCAIAACAMLLDSLAQAGASTMLLGFGADTFTLKTWGQPWRQTLPVLRSIYVEGDTNDWHALRMAHDALHQHHAERKVVLAITDGQGNMHRTAQQRQAGEALGIRHYGIGIGMDCSATWGARSVRIDKPADLAAVAFSRMRAAA